jgi:hypothetical protein
MCTVLAQLPPRGCHVVVAHAVTHANNTHRAHNRVQVAVGRAVFRFHFCRSRSVAPFSDFVFAGHIFVRGVIKYKRI